MALRLQYDDIEGGTIEEHLETALGAFCATPGDKVVFASYTAMLRLYALLSKQAGKTL